MDSPLESEQHPLVPRKFIEDRTATLSTKKRTQDFRLTLLQYLFYTLFALKYRFSTTIEPGIRIKLIDSNLKHYFTYLVILQKVVNDSVCLGDVCFVLRVTIKHCFFCVKLHTGNKTVVLKMSLLKKK